MNTNYNWDILYGLSNIPYAYKVSLDNTYLDLNKCDITLLDYYYGRINGLTFGLFILSIIDTNTLNVLTYEIDEIYNKRFKID